MTLQSVKWTIVLLVSFSVGVQAADRRAITHEDVWLMKRVGRPKLSPDGRWVAYALAHPAYDSKDQSSDIWIVRADGSGAPRQMTRTKGAEAGIDWSPDSRRIAFSAKRDSDESAQIYILDLLEGGEAERVTSISGGARLPKWSPDGTSLLFVGEVYPGAKSDEENRKAEKEAKSRKYNAYVYEGFPIRYWDTWLDERRPHLFVQAARAGAAARDLLAGTQLVALPGFAGQETESGQELTAVWTPDGKAVIFTAKTERDQSAYRDVATHLYQVSAQGGEPQALTRGEDSYGSPRFRPDGKALWASLNIGGDGKTYHHERVAAFPWPFDAARRVMLTAALDLSVAEFAPSSDSKTLYFTAENAERVTLFSTSADGGEITAVPLSQGGVLSGLNVENGVVIANWESAASPAEVGRIDVTARSWKALTRVNQDQLSKLDLPPIESFRFMSAQGREIHSLLVRPPHFDPNKKYPVFAVIHGGPAPQSKDAWSLRWNYHLLAAPGYVVLLTNYTGSRGYSEVFAQAIQGDPLKTPGDEINQAVDEAVRRYPFIDGNRLAAGGASYGGHLANWLQATTTRYRALISHAGLVNLESQWGTSDVIYHREVGTGGPIWEQGPIWQNQNPVRKVPNHFTKTGWTTPMLMTVGEKDYRVPYNNTLESWSYHQRLRIPSKLIVFPEENHWVLRGENSRFWYGEVHAWLARWLK